MLSRIETQNLGLVSPLIIELPERLSVIIGDNGLGKTLLLEIAWSILTQSWYHGKPLSPNSWSLNQETWISGTLGFPSTEENTFTSTYNQTRKAWHIERSPKQRPGIVIFIGTDGRYGVWDYMRNSYEEDTLFYRTRNAKEGVEGESEEPAAFIFDRSQLWNGLWFGDKVICNGLLRDWGEWQLESINTEKQIGNTFMGAPMVFQTLLKVLEKLSPPGETIIPGKPQRFSFRDARKLPVLSFKHGDIPLNQLSAGMQRIIEICYLIVWSVYENMQASMLRSMPHPSLDITLLFDEVELHLHPKWQRQIMDAILSVGEALPVQYRMQYLITTHAPMVLASLEPLFNSDTDQLFSYEITSDKKIAFEPLKWSAKGSANSWLSSLGLAEARSIKAENIILIAEKVMNGLSIEHSLDQVEKLLYETLPEKEPFLVRWKLFRQFGENTQ